MTDEEAWENYSYCQDGEDAAAIGMSDKYQEACDVLEKMLRMRIARISTILETIDRRKARKLGTL